jgi:hypothetical protein
MRRNRSFLASFLGLICVSCGQNPVCFGGLKELTAREVSLEVVVNYRYDRIISSGADGARFEIQGHMTVFSTDLESKKSKGQCYRRRVW